MLVFSRARMPFVAGLLSLAVFTGCQTAGSRTALEEAHRPAAVEEGSQADPEPPVRMASASESTAGTSLRGLPFSPAISRTSRGSS